MYTVNGEGESGDLFGGMVRWVRRLAWTIAQALRARDLRSHA